MGRGEAQAQQLDDLVAQAQQLDDLVAQANSLMIWWHRPNSLIVWCALAVSTRQVHLAPCGCTAGKRPTALVAPCIAGWPGAQPPASALTSAVSGQLAPRPPSVPHLSASAAKHSRAVAALTSVVSASLGPSSAPPLEILRASDAISSTSARSSAAKGTQGSSWQSHGCAERDLVVSKPPTQQLLQLDHICC